MSLLEKLDTITWESYTFNSVALEELKFNTEYVLLQPSIIWYGGFTKYMDSFARKAISYEVLHSAQIVYFYGSQLDRYDLSQFDPSKPQYLEYLFSTHLQLSSNLRDLETKCKNFGYYTDKDYNLGWSILPKDKFPLDQLKSPPRFNPNTTMLCN